MQKTIQRTAMFACPHTQSHLVFPSNWKSVSYYNDPSVPRITPSIH